MLNQRPIFLVAFARGGTNIVANLFISHPEVGYSGEETHQTFKSRNYPPESRLARLVKKLQYRPIHKAEGRDIFDENCWELRSPWQPETQERIDRVLFAAKLGLVPYQKLLFTLGFPPLSPAEKIPLRLFCKNVNGLIFLSQELARMYADATFIALVRNGFAICESNIRRGVPAEQIARNYHTACQQMIADAKALPNYHIFRYEDLMSAPQATYFNMLAKAGLEATQVKKVRLEVKRVLTATGQHEVVHDYQERDKVWYDIESFDQHLYKDANANQIAQLSLEQKQTIQAHCEESLAHFGYLRLSS